MLTVQSLPDALYPSQQKCDKMEFVPGQKVEGKMFYIFQNKNTWVARLPFQSI